LSTQDEDDELNAELDAAEAAAGQAEAEGESEAEREKRRKKGDLSDEVAARWSPERLLQMVAGRAGRGERLDEATRQKFERRLGVDLSGVRIYTGEFAEEVTRAHTAEAVTIGNTGMILMSGTPERSMGTTAGQALLAHELTHVAQAQQGMFRSAPGEDTPEFAQEHEAEASEAEAEEHQQAAGGGGGGGGGSPGEGDEDKDEQKEKVIDRVLDMFADQMRSDMIRGRRQPRRA
jgi:hypothetical protein